MDTKSIFRNSEITNRKLTIGLASIIIANKAIFKIIIIIRKVLVSGVTEINIIEIHIVECGIHKDYVRTSCIRLDFSQRTPRCVSSTDRKFIIAAPFVLSGIRKTFIMRFCEERVDVSENTQPNAISPH